MLALLAWNKTYVVNVSIGGINAILKDQDALSVECEAPTLTRITTLKGGGLCLTLDEEVTPSPSMHKIFPRL